MAARVLTFKLRSLHDAPDNGLGASATPSDCLALVETLTRESWELAGLPIPHL